LALSHIKIKNILAGMKRSIGFLFFLNSFLIASAQNTWVQKLSYVINTWGLEDDSLTGIKYLDIGADGDIYVIANHGLNISSSLYKISNTGAPVKWEIPVGFRNHLTAYFTNSVHATSDSGCIITYNFWQIGTFDTDGTIRKYSKDGILQWEHTFISSSPIYFNEAFDAIENIAGNYYALVGDTLYEFDPTGNILRFDSTISGKKLIELPNGNLIIQTLTGNVACRPFGGPDQWSISSAKLLTCNSKYAFVETTAGIQKVDFINGNISWTKSYPWVISDADTTTDGGFIACVGEIPGNIISNCTTCTGTGIVFKVDSIGDTLWSKGYTLPLYGFGKIKRTSSGNIITGGAFRFLYPVYNNDREFSSFLTSLDSSGNGVIETADYIWPGDDNNNYTLGLADDALYTVLAFGKTGPARDTIDLPQGGPCCKSDYAIDWPDTSVTGVNLKYTDFTGDGVIDTNDIVAYSNFPLAFPMNLPTLRIVNPDNQTQNVASLEIIPEDDSISPGDTVNFFIIAGSSTVPIDTICGIAFTGMWPWFTQVSITELNSDLGTIGSDLYSYSDTTRYSGPVNFFLNCRTNHQDVYQIHDTIGVVTVISNDTLSQIDSVYFDFYSSNAIKCNGDIIPLTVVSHAATVIPGSSGIHKINSLSFQIFPNPSNEYLNINWSKFSLKDSKVQIISVSGKIIGESLIQEESTRISTKGMSNGIYILSLQNSFGVFHKSFAVQH